MTEVRSEEHEELRSGVSLPVVSSPLVSGALVGCCCTHLSNAQFGNAEPTIDIACSEGLTISEVIFASYGNAAGSDCRCSQLVDNCLSILELIGS